MKDSKNFLLIYGVVILVILILIMFVIPDDIFMLKYKDVKLPEAPTEEKHEFVDYEVMKDNLLNNDHDYAYVLLDSMGTTSYEYDCEGKIVNNLESGTCKLPSSFSYTEETKKKAFKISTKYLDVKEIFDLIKDVEPEEVKYQSRKEYTYKTIIEDLDTDVIVYTDYDNITRIDISNAYMTYILKYSNIKN